MAIKLSDHIIIKRGSRPNPLSKYEVYNLNSNNNAIPYPIQSDINKNSLMLNKYKKMFKTNLGFKFEPAIKGDLLLSSSCDIGNAVILDLEKAFIDDKFFNIKTSPNLSKKYLQYWLLKNKKEISELGYGTTFKVLYLEPFKKYIDKIFFPHLDEQQEIINIIEPFERLKEIFSKKSSLLNEIKDKNKIYKSFKSFKDLIYVESSKGPILKTNNYKNKYRYFNCSSNISFCNTYNKEYDFDSLIITTRGTITSHIVPKNNKFYATNNILIYKGCGINCFDIYFKRNFKKFINGTAIPMITKTDLQEIKFSYLKEAETLLSKINSLDFCTQKLVNKINYIIQLLIELFMI